MGAMSAYAVSYLTGSPWLGVLAAAGSGCILGAVHALLCQHQGQRYSLGYSHDVICHRVGFFLW